MLQEPLILLPGLLSNETVWTHQLQHLSKMVRCQVIPLTFANNVNTLVTTILEQVEGNFFLAGHSMGGRIALELAKIAPDRILKLCLLNTSAQPDSPEKKQQRLALMDAVKNGQFHKVAMTLADSFVYNQRIKQDVISMILKVGEDAFLNQEQALLTRDDCRPDLCNLAMPTLIIHANQDQLFSLEVHQELASFINQARLAIIEEAGHMSPMESPEAVTTHLHSWLLDY